MARFKAGESGNRAGRPKGTKNPLSDKKLQEQLARGDQTALETVQDLMKNKNANVSLRAALAWLDMSQKQRQFMYKLLKEAEGSNGSKDVEEDDDKPVLSLKAVK